MKSSIIRYNLFLMCEKKILFISNKSHLDPLKDCLKEYKNYPKNCLLYDKIIGLAAARLIVYSGIISIVVTDVISEGARKLLYKNKIKVYTNSVVKNILNNNQSGPCPMELEASRIKNNKDFFEKMIGIKSNGDIL